MFWLFRYIYNLLLNLLTKLKPYPAIYDGLKVILAGAFFEASRRGSINITQVISECFTLKARIADNDEAFDWLHHYLSTHVPIQNQPHTYTSWIKDGKTNPYGFITILLDSIWPKGKSAPRDVQISTRKPRGRWWYGWGNNDSGKWGQDVLGDDKNKLKVSIVPTTGKMQLIKFQGKTIKMGIDNADRRAFDADRWFVMSTFLGTHQTFTSLLAVARNEYQALSSGSTAIYSPKATIKIDPSWHRSSNRPSRPWDSVILPKGVKESLLEDMQEFLREGLFYKNRGLPWRRGYLLYGVPGSGKSSLIAALAHKLKLDIYLVNLSSKGLDDDRLHGLLQACPGNCILLMEDIDCAFKKRKSKKKSSSSSSSSSESDSESSSSSSEDEKKKKKNKKKNKSNKKEAELKNSKGTGTKSSLSLSGLLNALDGVASSEGRLLFCTTNWVDKIDEALSRPGRCDVWIEFTNTTESQTKDVFLQFYRNYDPPTSSEKHAILSADKIMASHIEKEKAPLEVPLVSNDLDDTSHEAKTDPDISQLAEKFCQAIPEGSVSVSSLQGYLMRYKRNPLEAVEGVPNWVKSGYGKGPTMTLSKAGVEMKQLGGDKGDKEKDEEDLGRDKADSKKDKKDRKDKKDKKDKKKGKDDKDDKEKDKIHNSDNKETDKAKLDGDGQKDEIANQNDDDQIKVNGHQEDVSEKHVTEKPEGEGESFVVE